MRAVVADQHPRVRPFDRGSQPLAVGDVVGDRLLDQRGDTRVDARERVVHVQRVRRRDDHAVRSLRGEEFRERGVERHTGRAGGCGRRRGRIDERDERAQRALVDELHVPPADDTGACDRDFQGFHRSLHQDGV